MATNRNGQRYRVSWKIALIFDEAEDRPTYHGRTHDLTRVGTGMLVHYDVFSELPVTVLLAIPPPHRDRRQQVIEIKARQVYSVYSGETFCFRLGLEFDQFKGDGLRILEEGLSRHRPLIEIRTVDEIASVFESLKSSQSM
jgi:hypothetical protein